MSKEPIFEVISKYKILKSQKLGEGATGQVYYGQSMENGTKVAVKRVDINKVTTNIEKQLENQITNLKALNSPFIVRLYQYFRSGNYIYIILEYCEDGDLKTYLKNNKNNGLCEAEALLFMKYMIEGYRALNSKNIIHRDIKPANILLKQGIAKLSDFGFSRVVNDPTVSQKLTLLGTPLYTAIQILRQGQFSSKCDVWSMGIVFYEMLHGKTPWNGTDLTSLRENILSRKIEFKGNINPEIKEMITQMLKIDSKERIDWHGIFDHHLFKSIAVKLPQENVESNYKEIRNISLEYMKNYFVKSYLRINMEKVGFKESYEPMQEKETKIIEQYTADITLKRNIAFFYAYVLTLYYNNQKLISEKVNRCMEFQYALSLKIFQEINSIAMYIEKQNTQMSPDWQIYKISAQFEELRSLLSNDFYILERLKKVIKKDAELRFSKSQLPKETGELFTSLTMKFNESFFKIMEINYKALMQDSKKPVCALLADYISQYIGKPKLLEGNIHLDFGSLYEKREREYGLV